MAGTFDTIITQGVRAGQIPARTEAARTWYRESARNYGATTRKGGTQAGRTDFSRRSPSVLIKEDEQRLTNIIRPGNMYMYQYDPKLKDELPFYDRFPLIFPFRVEADRFWAINLHYLGLRQRAVLMDALYSLSTNKRFDETTKLRMNYETLNRAAKFRFFKPCVKQYLFSHMKSRFMYIYPSEWDIALFLPTERFVKASKTQVHAKSRAQLGVR